MTERHRENPNGRSRIENKKYVLVILLLALAGVGGVLVGTALTQDPAVVEEGRRVDEYQGLAQRTGLTGDLALFVQPVSLSVQSGQPIPVNLRLVNRSKKKVLLNNRLTPSPAQFKSNQLPFKVMVSRSGRQVPYHGDVVLLPPQEKNDFIPLRRGESKVIPMDLSKGVGGQWDMREPGNYAVEIWYETYLSGKYIGVKAWTGMTNHVVVQVNVTGEK